MSVFTTVTPADLEQWLTRYSVGPLSDLRGISAGIENTNYFVTAGGNRYVLTLFEKLTLSELPFYLNLMAHLADHGLPSARPVADRDGCLLNPLNGKPASLVAFLPGKDVSSPNPAQCAEVGRILARIHVAGQNFGMRMDNPRGASWWKRVMPELLPFLAQDAATLLTSEIAFQDRHPHADLPAGAIHADLFRDNVLLQGDRISGVIDFYFACTGALLYDLAITVNDWCLGDGATLDGDKVLAMVDAYTDVRPLCPAEKAAWPHLLRAGALRFWVSRLFDLHLPRPGELTHAKDPSHFRQLLEHHIGTARAL
jgi:homoserine kinase type II